MMPEPSFRSGTKKAKLLFRRDTMQFEHVHLLYFSPTATTKTILNQIAKGIGKPVLSDTDITRPDIRHSPAPEFKNSLVLIGAPVYAGRLPKEAAQYIKTIKAFDCLAVPVVLYGNREFEDALLELKNSLMDCGFVPLAAGAFIGEHSFSSPDLPIAPNRPDEQDLETALQFGKKINDVVSQASTLSDITRVDVPGNFPYKQGPAFGSFSFIDVSDACDDCGICLTACPKNAIDPDDHWATRDEPCIYCCACIKACPLDARIMKAGPIMEKTKWLNENCSQRKNPSIF